MALTGQPSAAYPDAISSPGYGPILCQCYIVCSLLSVGRYALQSRRRSTIAAWIRIPATSLSRGSVIPPTTESSERLRLLCEGCSGHGFSQKQVVSPRGRGRLLLYLVRRAAAGCTMRLAPGHSNWGTSITSWLCSSIDFSDKFLFLSFIYKNSTGEDCTSDK